MKIFISLLCAVRTRKQMSELKILKQIIGVLYDACPGMYPKAHVGKYEKRTPYMEGWNAALIAHTRETNNILSDFGVELYDNHICIDEPEVKLYSD